MRGRIIKNEGKRGVSYTVVVDVGTDSKDRKQKKKTFKKKGDAERWLAETIAAVKKGTYVEPVKMTVGQWLKEWLETYGRQNLSPTSYEWYKTTIEKHLIPELGDITLSDLKPKHIKDYHYKALEGGRKDGKVKTLGKKLSSTTVKNHHAVLRKALQTALELEMIIRNPADAAKPPKKAKYEVDFLPEEDVNKIIDLFKGTYMFMPVYLAVTTGARRGEILALRWADIDFNNSVAYIGRALYSTKEHGLIFKEPKNKSSIRAVALSAEVIKVLKKHKTEQKKEKLAFGPEYQNKNDLICCLQDGSPIVPATVTKRFQDVVEKAGYKLTFHGLRHAHASYLLKQGIHPKVVSERLGHSNISTTLDIYSHTSPALQREAVNKLDDILFKKENVTECDQKKPVTIL
jgi:integrase